VERGAEERSGGVYWGASNTAGLLETFDSTALGPARLGVELEVAVLIGPNEAAVSHREVDEHDCHSGLESDLVVGVAPNKTHKLGDRQALGGGHLAVLGATRREVSATHPHPVTRGPH